MAWFCHFHFVIRYFSLIKNTDCKVIDWIPVRTYGGVPVDWYQVLWYHSSSDQWQLLYIRGNRYQVLISQEEKYKQAYTSTCLSCTVQSRHYDKRWDCNEKPTTRIYSFFIIHHRLPSTCPSLLSKIWTEIKPQQNTNGCKHAWKVVQSITDW